MHTNGYTLVRKLIDRHRASYTTKLTDGRRLGEHLLTPSKIYVPVIEACLNQGVDIHYTAHVTGHGWTKLMRLDKPFNYVIDKLPTPPLIFEYLQTISQLSNKEMYATFSMGAGLVIYAPEEYVSQIVTIGEHHHVCAFQAGYIERSRDKKIVIEPQNIVFATNLPPKN